MASMHFSPAPTSVGAARRFVVDVLRHAVDDEGLRRAQLAVSELATNAVLHACTPFVVEVEVTGGVVRLAVTDGSSQQPLLREAAVCEAGGRGLMLLRKLSLRWGVDEGAGQKTVWCDIAARA